jgi:hypothetical protein
VFLQNSVAAPAGQCPVLFTKAHARRYSGPDLMRHTALQIASEEVLLQPLRTRKRFNISEFGYYINAQMELLVAKKQPDGACKWLEMWQQMDPENPLVLRWQMRLNARNVFQRLFRKV